MKTREHDILCVLCAVYCYGLAEESISEVIKSADTCQCADHDPAKIDGKVKQSLTEDEIPLESLAANNVFLKNFKQNITELN